MPRARRPQDKWRCRSGVASASTKPAAPSFRSRFARSNFVAPHHPEANGAALRTLLQSRVRGPPLSRSTSASKIVLSTVSMAMAEYSWPRLLQRSRRAILADQTGWRGPRNRRRKRQTFIIAGETWALHDYAHDYPRSDARPLGLCVHGRMCDRAGGGVVPASAYLLQISLFAHLYLDLFDAAGAAFSRSPGD